MARNALRADDVSWLFRTVKMLHCVAFRCNNQAKSRKDTSMSFHVFPKDNDLLRAWIEAVGRTSLPKYPRLRSQHFDADCFEDTMRLQNELLGSCPWKRNLKPEAIPTIFSTNQPGLLALLAVDAPRRDNDKRFVSTPLSGTMNI